MIFTWWRNWRRRRFAERPAPEAWRAIIERNVRQYAQLDDARRGKLIRLVKIFVHEKYWEGCNGLTITEEIQVTIAGHACLLLLGFEGEVFNRLSTVLVYPDAYVAKSVEHQPGGVVRESLDLRLGEAWTRGPVIISWDDVNTAEYVGRRGHNVVLHEFAHVLDMQDGGADGTPVLESDEQYDDWVAVMTAEYNRLVHDSAHRKATLLDQYGATNSAEFFAVATECFFERPQETAAHHSRLYDVLRRFYRQDPTEWAHP